MSVDIINTVKKKIKEAKIKGSLDLSSMPFYNTLFYYIDYSEESKDCLTKMLKCYANKDDDSCRIIQYTDDNSTTQEQTTCKNFILKIGSLNPNQFNFSNLILDNFDYVKIYISRVSEGFFLYNGQLVMTDLELTRSQLDNLVFNANQFYGDLDVIIEYRLTLGDYITETCQFTISLESNENQPPTVGDITLYRDNRSITVITLDMLTNMLTPPYNDPENDILDSIRVEEVSTANEGIYYYNNNPLFAGLVISRQDIINGLLEHRSANTNSISSDTFNFSVRDSGSMQWVS